MSDDIAVAFSDETGKRCTHMAGILYSRLYLGLYEFHTSGMIQFPSTPPGSRTSLGSKYECFIALNTNHVTITVGYPQYTHDHIKDYKIIELSLTDLTSQTQIGDSIYVSSYEDLLKEIKRFIP